MIKPLTRLLATSSLIASALVGGTALSASAESNVTTDPQVFAGYVRSSHYAGLLVEAVMEAEKRLPLPVCNAMQVEDADITELLQPAGFAKHNDGELTIISGAWIARAHLVRCGKKVFRRILFRVQENDLKRIALLPGDFRGNLRLEMDSSRIALPKFAAEANCNGIEELRVFDVIPHGEASEKGWSETWMMDACGKTLEGKLTYSPSDKGMDISGEVVKIQ